ncbi:GDSL-type esterase/lipase family protein [Defluviitalea raffinosedens]|uniref:GDSL-type esterase/lipase family protein n=1 Tax=Defluviitalea raffinosedens TaxID=1450156 RepID=UPI00195EBA9A|nr:GDSL-type esterase/lipase family protein [Defluviitalea raffinosedens]MBM7686270.1 lysophospholipase L1-like esterase [Defluviitalea raffinosedens]
MKKHIVCFGDSNTYGYRASDNGRFSEDERWTCLLSKKLGPDYLILEEGLPGRTTCFEDPIHEGLSGLSYIYPCLMSHAPVDLLIIMLGTNDTKERFGVSAVCIALGLKRLIAKAIATTDCWANKKPNILVVTPKSIEKEYENTAVYATMGKGCAEKSDQLREEYPKIAEMMGVHYFDANTVVKQYNKIDYMHLDEEGHEALATALAQLIPTII